MLSFIDLASTFGAILACADPHESLFPLLFSRKIASLSIKVQLNEEEFLCLD